MTFKLFKKLLRSADIWIASKERLRYCTFSILQSVAFFFIMGIRKNKPGKRGSGGKFVSSPGKGNGSQSVSLSDRFSSLYKGGGSSSLLSRLGTSTGISSRLGVQSVGSPKGKAGKRPAAKRLNPDAMAIDAATNQSVNRSRGRRKEGNKSGGLLGKQQAATLADTVMGDSASPVSKARRRNRSRVSRRAKLRQRGGQNGSEKLDAAALDKQLDSYMMQNPEYASQKLDQDLDSYMAAVAKEDGSNMKEVDM